MKYFKTLSLIGFLNKLGNQDTVSIKQGANGPFLSITIDGERVTGLVAKSLHEDVLNNKLNTSSCSISWVETNQGDNCWMLHPTNGTNSVNTLLVLK